ncbi:Endonuclease/Exonuclease/phosphatase family protein [Halpernia humi]|uniref:Endonuclease/Exonuclease/phosphatase family protein n=1 Tax=Halpernia humi TaxID=493375 RepID=A0A1H6BHS4_9FLAO|nr:endonuclease [Halpernia humi]SEG60240.1 Endonuclease/Exonuclease/phosphatase family protein [Halpernia humi]
MPNQSQEELIFFYNVENLFPPDEKAQHILNPTDSGLRNWDEKRYENKIKKIAHVLELVKEEHQNLPVFIGLAEISSDSVLEDIIKQPVFENNYAFIQYESMDERGVDVALLYDKTKCEILDSEPISFIFEFENPGDESFDTTRDVLFCKVKFKNKIINFYVVHLPSKRDKDINKPKRQYILNNIKQRILKEKQENAEAFIVMGDFNENANDDLLENFSSNGENQLMINPFSELFRNKQFSTFHNSDGLLFDQILLSSEFFTPNYPINFEKAFVFNNIKLGSWDRKFHGRPFRTYAGTRYLGGYSDHFPVLVKLKINE